MSRLSSIYRSGGSGSSYSGRRNHLVVQKDEFPILDYRELSLCLQTCDLIATEELVTKPTSQFMRAIFEQILDIFVAVPPIQITRKVRAMTNRDSSLITTENENSLGRNDEVSEEDDTENTLHILVFFRAVYSFLQTCGISDFTLSDLMKPDAHRTRRILSAVINYARFREEHSQECEILVVEGEKNSHRIKELQQENNRFTNDIQQLNEQIQEGIVSEDNNSKKTSLKQINAFNYRLENELKKLQKAQQILTLEHSQYKEQKQRLIEKLEDHHYLSLESKKELDKLKGYLSTNPEMLKKIIEELKNSLTDYQNEYYNLESTFRNKSTTIESIQVIEQELKSLFRILEEILNDLQKSETAVEKLNEYQEILEQQKHSSSDLNRQIQQFKRQLNNIEEKIKKLRNQAAERDKKSKETLATLKADYEDLVEERRHKEQELDQRKEMIASLEKSMAANKKDFQIEVRNAETAISRLTSHIKLYLTEMNNKMSP